MRGWQPTRVMVKSGDKLAITATGEWLTTKSGKKVTADGDDNGQGTWLAMSFAFAACAPAAAPGSDDEALDDALQSGRWGDVDRRMLLRLDSRPHTVAPKEGVSCREFIARCSEQLAVGRSG